MDSLGNMIPLDTVEMVNDTISLDVPPGTTPSIKVRKKKN